MVSRWSSLILAPIFPIITLRISGTWTLILPTQVQIEDVFLQFL